MAMDEKEDVGKVALEFVISLRGKAEYGAPSRWVDGADPERVFGRMGELPNDNLEMRLEVDVRVRVLI